MFIEINRNLSKTLTNQIYEQIRVKILNGQLKKGERLPSTRHLALDLQVSRNIVIEAYDKLYAEGFIQSIRGSGTFVAEGAYLEAININENETYKGTSIVKAKKEDYIDFRSGTPALDLLPAYEWGKTYKKICNESSYLYFSYNNPERCMDLNIVLANYLLKTRGVRCSPDQIVITYGAVHALYLISHLLLGANDLAVIEDPLTNDLKKIITSTGASLFPVSVDDNGLQTDLIPDEIHPRLIYTVPSHQFPLGGILPIQRRIDLIKFARCKDCYIVEDDYDSEFRYSGPPISSLQSLDPNRVLYIGTFSKILFPSLRLGYIILPRELLDDFIELKRLMVIQTPTLAQLTLADFIKEGHFERHIRRMKKIYKKRQSILIESLKRAFGDHVKISGNSTGLHLIAAFENVIFTKDIIKELDDEGVRVYPVEVHSIKKGSHQDKIILGYGNLKRDEIIEGVNRMKRVIKGI